MGIVFACSIDQKAGSVSAVVRASLKLTAFRTMSHLIYQYNPPIIPVELLSLCSSPLSPLLPAPFPFFMLCAPYLPPSLGCVQEMPQ
jgi:hypothetical protein